jgi:hypothetical protein
VTASVVVALAACAPASIGEYPDTEGIELPNRRSSSADASTDDGSTPPGSGNRTFALTVTLGGSGTGTVSSTPGGLTCQGKTCTGSFPSGTAVTVVPAPAAGSLFAGWGGGCSGAGACAPVLTGDVAVAAELESLAGTWSGTYTNTRQAFGCTFGNKGDLSITFAADGTAFFSTGSINGLELRSIPSCNLVRSTTGSAPKESVNLSGNALTGTWTFDVQGADGTLAFPYTGTASGKKLTGSWTCPTCAGSFTLTKQ